MAVLYVRTVSCGGCGGVNVGGAEKQMAAAQALDTTGFWYSKWPLWVEEESERGEPQAFPGTGYVGFCHVAHQPGKISSSASSDQVSADNRASCR